VDVIDLAREKGDKVVHHVSRGESSWAAGGSSRLLTLDHNDLASCLDSEIADLQYSAYLVWKYSWRCPLHAKLYSQTERAWSGISSL